MAAVLGAIGLVHHHALGEEAGERLLQCIGVAGLRMARVKKRE